MQKPKWYDKHVEYHNLLELEIFQEKASSLGRAGKQLSYALEHYEAAQEDTEKAERLDQVAEAAWKLVLQREFAGFTDKNLDWITQHYRIPTEALSRLGARQKHE